MAKAVSSMDGGNLHNIDADSYNRELFDAGEMMFQSFERNVTGQAQVPAGAADYSGDPRTFPDMENPAYSSYMSEAAYYGHTKAPGQPMMQPQGVPGAPAFRTATSSTERKLSPPIS